MNDKISLAGLRARLEETLEWPHEYVFKFIVKVESGDVLRDMFSGDDVRERYSRRGRYVSLTVIKTLNSSEQVIAVYEKVRTVPGVIML
jgi:putative lipoic acid-binding regulatory protein